MRQGLSTDVGHRVTHGILAGLARGKDDDHHPVPVDAHGLERGHAGRPFFGSNFTVRKVPVQGHAIGPQFIRVADRRDIRGAGSEPHDSAYQEEEKAASLSLQQENS